MKTSTKTDREGWILDEDFALRQLLEGITVEDQSRDNRKVGVWFGHPDQELRAQSYPYITIDLIDVSEETDRAERGYYTYDGGLPIASGVLDEQPSAGTVLLMHTPLPIRLTYQVTTFARNPRHDRQLMNEIIRNRRIPMHGGILKVSDHTDRRLDVLDFSKNDTVETSKRLLSNVLIVAVSSEVPWETILTASRVSKVFGSLRSYVTDGNETVETPEEDFELPDQP